jgi:hypothetical protein
MFSVNVLHSADWSSGNDFQRRTFPFLCVLELFSSSATSSSQLQLSIPGIFLGSKGRPARKGDNLTAICEPIV